jgi:hypothetical protein
LTERERRVIMTKAGMLDLYDEFTARLRAGPGRHQAVAGGHVKVDMSAAAVTLRLKRVSQLRRLCLALAKAKPAPPAK